MSIRRSLVFRAVFITASLLFWCCAVVAGLELWARVFTPEVPKAPPTVCFSLTRARETYTSVYERHMKPWPAPMPMHPPVEVYGVQDDAQREATANNRGEWVVLFDNQFRVVRTYGAPLADLPQWTSLGAPGRLLAGLGERAQTPQFLDELNNRMKSLFDTGFASNMFMDLQAESAEGSVRVDARFVPVRYDMAVKQGIAAFRRSVWMAGGKKHFAAHARMLEESELVMMEQFSTNNLGFRGPDVAVPKPAGRVRIACVGGSTTVEGYDDRMTYPAMLQDLLREKFPQAADRIEVVNCGVIGLLSREELPMLPEFLALEPDLVVYYNGINDLRFDYTAWLNSDAAWPTPYDRFRRALGKSAFLRRFWHDKFIPSDAVLKQRVRTATMDNLEKLFSGLKGAGIPVAVCSFVGPEPDVLDPDGLAYADTQFVPPWFENLNLREWTRFRGFLNEGFRRLCDEQKLIYLPVAEEQRTGFDHFTDLCHMTPKGIETKAGIVCGHIAPLVAERLGVQ